MLLTIVYQLEQFQDVGFDGMSDEIEQQFFEDYLNQAQATISDPNALGKTTF
jgi:hypothetical protein